MGQSIYDEVFPYSRGTQFLPATGTAVTSIVPAGTAPRRIDSILCVNRDTIAHEVVLTYNDGGTQLPIGSTIVAAGAGYGGTPSIDILKACLPVSQSGVVLTGSGVLSANVVIAVTATYDLSIVAMGGLL